MSKAIIYFPHDTDSRNDTRMKRLVMKEGMAGLGIYWCLVELLHENYGKLEFSQVESIAFDIHSNYDSITNVIQAYDLFQFDEVEFWSDRVNKNISDIMDKSSKSKAAIQERWRREREKKDKATKDLSNKENNTGVHKSDTDVIPINEIKVNDIKAEDKTNTPQTPKGAAHVFIDLNVQIAEFKIQNPNKYAQELYDRFIEYWDAQVINGRGKGKPLWQSQTTWTLSGRLATWHSKNNNNSKTNVKPTLTPEQRKEEALAFAKRQNH